MNIFVCTDLGSAFPSGVSYTVHSMVTHNGVELISDQSIEDWVAAWSKHGYMEPARGSGGGGLSSGLEPIP